MKEHMSGPESLNVVNPRPFGWGRIMRWVLGAQLLLLLAMAQVMFAGYRLGVGNQSIQIPFLKHSVDSQLYANDPMVKETMGDYSTYFFRMLSVVVARFDLYSVYFWLHVLTAAAVLLAAYGLGKAIFKDRASGVVLALLMLAGHHHALAGDDLYSLGFTHTWFVFPLALLALIFLYKDWYFAAFALLGIIFNLHALTAGYLLVMFLAWAVVDYRRPGWPWLLAAMLALFAILAMPTLLDMLRHRQQFGHDWLERTRVRSGDHSFPSTWWTSGQGDVPRFVLLLGLTAVAMSFSADRRNQRKSLLLAAGAGFMFLIGYVFSDIWPIATVVRAQLFRSSRLVVVLMLAHLAHGIVTGLRQANLRRIWKSGAATPPWRGSSEAPAPAPAIAAPALNYQSQNVRAPIPIAPIRPIHLLEGILAIAAFFVLAIPGLMSLAPWLLLASLLVALISSRLSIAQTIVASAAMFVILIARRTIDYDIPGIDGTFSLQAARQSWHEAGQFLWLALLVAPVVWLFIQLRIGPRAKLCVSTAVLIVCSLLALKGERTMAVPPLVNTDPWIEVQRWAAAHTPKNALFLTPTQPGGFRIYSGRSVVCEWRDGTQLYFSADFAQDWWSKLTTLRPLSYGKALEEMSDQDIVKLARDYGATEVVLPASKSRELDQVFANSTWAVYKPKILDEQARFMKNVVQPNIEKYRKSDARLELTDANGRTLTDGDFQITQTKQAFGFGCSLPFFDTPAGDSGRDQFEPPQVTQKELKLFKELFNYTVIPFSAKWQRIEPEEGERHYEELDKYVDWCVKNGITIEFHYLSGFEPTWVRYKTSSEQKRLWLRYCRDMVTRYHDRIKYWQVVNDSYLVEWAPDAFKEIRALYPDLKLGVSHCAQFYVPYSGGRSSSGMFTGMEDVKAVQEEGAKVDFFSTHGHKPMGVWPDMRTIYTCFDGFSELGVKIHISEATLDLGQRFLSPVRTEKVWTPELAAEFYENYYTTAFSYPTVEAINYWDLSTSIKREGLGSMLIGGTGQAGLLDPDKDDEPRPLYYKLKELIRDRWMTRLSGQIKADGAVAFRGFHGDYAITVKTPDGKTLHGTFSINPDANNAIQLRLSENASVATSKS